MGGTRACRCSDNGGPTRVMGISVVGPEFLSALLYSIAGRWHRTKLDGCSCNHPNHELIPQ